MTRSRINQRLEALEATRTGPNGGAVCYEPTGCPHDAAQQYRDMLDRGGAPPMMRRRSVPSDEAERVYRKVMGDAA